MHAKRSNSRLNLSAQAKVRSTRIRNVWMVALKRRLRPRLVVLRLGGFSLMLGIRLALKMPPVIKNVPRQPGERPRVRLDYSSRDRLLALIFP
jgi:hypothetical protein